MIKEFSFYHGVVFSSLFHYCDKPFTIVQYPSSDNASYIVNNNVGVYIKYSTKRLSPWHFSFQNLHLSEMQKMNSMCNRLILILVCRDDGIVGLSSEEFQQIVNSTNNGTEWISINRGLREKYSVKGSAGKLIYKISKTDFCDKILC